MDSSDAIIVGGYSYSTDLDSQSNAGSMDVMVMKFSSAGAHQWTVLRGGSGNDIAYALEAGRAELFVVHVPEHLLGKLWHGLNFRRESFKLFRYVLMQKCTPLWREAHFQVKVRKAHHVRTTVGNCDVEKVHTVVARNTF